MIYVFYVPGMFGSTIEAMLSRFTIEFENDVATLDIADDGSMHLFNKQFHPLVLDRFKEAGNQSVDICTPIYPMKDAKLPEIVQNMSLTENDRVVLIYADSIDSAEQNMLFQHYKIAVGLVKKWPSVILIDHPGSDVSSWNKDYKSWKDMQVWELRELLSISYDDCIQDWMTSKDVKFEKDVLLLTNTEILNNLEGTFIKLCKHFNLTLINDEKLSDFCNKWTDKQQYIVNEFKLIEPIVKNTIDNTKFEWPELSIVAESIIQNRLRLAGYNLRCYNLNKFPTNSLELNTLLEKY